MKLKLPFLGLLVASSFMFAGCNDDDDAGADSSLRILHINDHHSHLDPGDVDLELAGTETRAIMGGFPRVVAKFKALSDGRTDVLKLHAGDAITGDLYYTLFKGQADAAMMNQVCFDAFALGNHEFDDGDEGLVNFLNHLNANATCDTPVLAANVVPEVGVSPLAPNSATDYLQPYVVKEVEGTKYGIIGIDIAQKTKNSSNPDETTQFLDETETAQQYIDELAEQGVHNIILLTHYQYQNDLALARSLTGVDVIIGGDSHSLLGEQFAGLGLSPAGPYPTQVTNKDGHPVCVAQAWQYASVVGELQVSFRDGNVHSCSGTPHMLLGDTFEREDAEGEDYQLSGAELEAVKAEIDNIAELSIVTPDAETETLLARYASQVEQLSAERIGTAAEDLCLARFPGDGRSQICSAEDTAANGSDISNIVSKAFLEMSNTSDFCIQNGGGVRVDVPAGDITIGTAYTLLPFANTLVEIEMTGQQIKEVLEEAIVYALDEDGSTGAYPYASGLRWTLDLSQPAGSRFSNIEMNPRVAGDWQPLDLDSSYKVVTNSFVAGGRDGYLTFGEIAAEKKVDTFLDYAQSFVDYVEREEAAGRAVTKLPLSEYSTQRYINAEGVAQ